VTVEDLINLLEDFRKHDPQALVMARSTDASFAYVTGAKHEIHDREESTGGSTIWLQTEDF
jgi:hypothetical protein